MKDFKSNIFIYLLTATIVILILIAGAYVYLNKNQTEQIETDKAVYVDQKLRDRFEAGINEEKDCVGLDPWLADDCYQYLAVKNNDISICDTPIEGIVGFKDSCYLNFAGQNNDLSVCNKLSEFNQVWCYNQIARQTNNIKLCEEKTVFTTKYTQEECYRGVAIDSKDSSLCLKISDDLRQSLCYLQSKNEIEKAKISYCENIKTTNERYACYNEVAIGQSNVDYCDKIDPDYQVVVYGNITESLRNSCIKKINDFLSSVNNKS